MGEYNYDYIPRDKNFIDKFEELCKPYKYVPAIIGKKKE